MTLKVGCEVILDGEKSYTVAVIDDLKIVGWNIGDVIISGVTLKDLKDIRESFLEDNDEVFVYGYGSEYVILKEQSERNVFAHDFADTGVRIPKKTIDKLIYEIKDFSLKIFYLTKE